MDMTPETKFRGLEAAAMARLSRPLEGSELIGVRRASVFVLIWRYPSFEPYKSWALIQARGANADEWFVRRTTWERSIDYGRAADPLKQAALMVDADPRPTLEVLDATVDSDFATKFLGTLGELTVPKLLTPEGIGIDGVVNGLETHLGQGHLEWWCNGPTAWQSLTEEVERLRLDLEAAVLAHPTIKRPE